MVAGQDFGAAIVGFFEVYAYFLSKPILPLPSMDADDVAELKGNLLHIVSQPVGDGVVLTIIALFAGPMAIAIDHCIEKEAELNGGRVENGGRNEFVATSPELHEIMRPSRGMDGEAL